MRVKLLRKNKYFALLLPDYYFSSIFEIDLERLYQRGIRAILLDLDNTIIKRDIDIFSEEIVGWVQEAKHKNFKICIVSNNQSKRVYPLARKLGLPAICRFAKPLRTPFRQAMKLLGSEPGETVIVGDQIFTDILGGNRLGLCTILVTPLDGKEFWTTRLINRPLEKIVLRWVRKS
jgi:HAD superfamily phosphatase (TIGR01668 family)